MRNIYSAFWKKPSPYSLEGSYAFFTSIKNGDIAGLEIFLSKDEEYLYEEDHKGRSPLTFAVIHEKRQVVNYLLEKDIDVDHKCYRNKTPLF